ncbi:tyrosine-type recombinase/integrase [Sinomonas sp. P10A9]|uniref:Tyrosine-type recombinase/integrase n=1 Tax=Sinomonas puerhi TaxID=3238584 RepID=A0AB39L0M5_9MICC
MADVSRRCGCRDESGKVYGTTAATRCPQMANPRHGSWGFRFSAGSVPDPQPGAPGKTKRRYVQEWGYKTAKEAKEAREAAGKKYKGQGDRFFDKTTVGEFLTDWMDRQERQGELRPSTARMYRSYLVKDIVPVLGDKRLVKLTRNDVAGFVDSLRDAGRGATTVRRIHATLSSALSSAVKRGMLDFNPASRADLPDAAHDQVKVWGRDDTLRFLEAAHEHRLGDLYEVAIMTGLRRGELCGLRWEDVDLVEGRLSVRRNLVQVGNEVREGQPKTTAGERSVGIPAHVVDLLAKLKDRQDAEREAWAEAYQDSGRVFTYEDGRQLRPGYPSKVLETLVKRLGLPSMRFHDLRHLFASIQLDAGTPMAMVSKLMGHSTIAITADLYSHLMDDAAARAAEAAASWLRPSPAPVVEPVEGL